MLEDAAGIRRVILCCGYCDLRKGILGLAQIVGTTYKLNPYEQGTLFLFCGNKRNCIKGICFDRDGCCMIVKRLTDGVYQWPRNTDEAMALSQDEFHRLMEGFTVQSSIRVFERKNQQ